MEEGGKRRNAKKKESFGRPFFFSIAHSVEEAYLGAVSSKGLESPSM